LIVNCIFGLESGLNLNLAEKQSLQWPLRTVTRADLRYEFEYIYEFLSTDSLFWSVMFRLTNLHINFKLPLNLLPNFIRFRIENNLSVLASRLDSMNFLNLSN
jgi:hypothetical protein